MTKVGSWNRELIDDENRLEGSFDEVDPYEEGNRGRRNWILKSVVGILTLLVVMMMAIVVFTVVVYIPLSILNIL